MFYPWDDKHKKCSVIKRVMNGGIWEQKIATKIYKDCKKSTTVIDIGANIGAHTIHMLDAVSPDGFVIAFEPQIEISNCLKNTLDQIGNNYIISNDLVSNQNSTSTFMTNGTGMSRIPLKNGIYNKNWSKHTIKTITLDSFLQNKNYIISLIKIDVEGHEFQVLEGAKNTINKYKPIIYIEVWKHTGDIDKLINWCLNNNYNHLSISPNDFKLEPII